MNFREFVIGNIQKELPFLKKIKIEIDGNYMTDFISEELLPYLFYTNTIKKNHRIISMFLRQKEDAIKLPLYYSFALFKSYAEQYLSKLNFKDEYFCNRQITIRDNDSSICTLEAIKYTSQDIVIKSGRGPLKNICFQDVLYLEAYNKYTGYYRNLSPYFEKINGFNSSLRIRSNPLELIPKMDNVNLEVFKNKSGVLYFTSYDKSYKEIKINNIPFFDTIPASMVKYSQGKLECNRLGSRRSQNGKAIDKLDEFIVFTNPENYSCFYELKKEKNWINTLIFDFTKDLKNLDNILNLIKNQYLESLNNGEIKDIYLLFNEKDLSNYFKIFNSKINHSPFLLSVNQKTHFLGGNGLIEPEILKTNSDDNNIAFKEVSKIIESLCEAVHIIYLKDKLLYPFFEIRNRYTSFYDQEHLTKTINQFESDLTNIKSSLFYSSEFKDDFSSINYLLESIKNNLSNPKLALIEGKLLNKGNSICVITYNSNEQDYLFLRRKLKNNNITFINPKKIKNPLTELEKFDCVLIFNTNQDLRFTLKLNAFKQNFLILVNETENLLLEKISGSIIPRISNSKKLAEILNIEEGEISQEKTSQVIFTKEEEFEENFEFNIDDFISKILKKNQNNTIYINYVQNKNIDQVLLFFDDETSMTVNESKYFFVVKENIKSLKECHIQAKELKERDIVFLFNRDSDEFEKLVWDISKNYPEINELLNIDLEWRQIIANFIKGKGISIDDFRVSLNSLGLSIISNQTIQMWINGDVYEPRKLRSLFLALSELSIINEEHINKYIRVIKIVKELKTKLPYELIKMHIANLNDAEYQSNYKFPELSEKMIQFMDIKTISMII